MILKNCEELPEIDFLKEKLLSEFKKTGQNHISFVDEISYNKDQSFLLINIHTLDEYYSSALEADDYRRSSAVDYKNLLTSIQEIINGYAEPKGLRTRFYSDFMSPSILES